MTDLSMKDSAAPTTAGPITDIILIYVGGDTPDPWSDAQIASQPERFRLPTWVRSDPGGFSGSGEASVFAAWLHSRGVPHGVTVCLDLETAVNAAYVNGFNSGMRSAGFKLMKYGSKDFIFQNPKTDGGTFVADPTGVPHMVTEGDTVATQYAFDGAFDLSLVLPSVPLWPRSGTKPPPPANWTEHLVQNLPTLANGSTGQDVRNMQGLLTAHGHSLVTDGIFGPNTLSHLREFQSAAHLTVDGICGQNTWTALIG